MQRALFESGCIYVGVPPLYKVFSTCFLSSICIANLIRIVLSSHCCTVEAFFKGFITAGMLGSRLGVDYIHLVISKQIDLLLEKF